MIRHKRTKRGKGIFDMFKPAMETAKDVVNIGENTKDIIKQIKKTPSAPQPVDEIVNRITKLRVGSGFAYI